MCWRLGGRLIVAALICCGAIGQELARAQTPKATGIGQSRPTPEAQERIEPALESQPVPEPREEAGPEQSQEQATQQPTEADRLIPAIDAIVGAIDDLITEDDAIERDRQQREIADLQAQQDMALWAEGMFWAAFASVWVTAAGVYLIWRTLGHTRRAADAAVATLDEAEKSTCAAIKAADAAIKANTLQRDMFIAENRPWLCLESVSVAAPLTWDGGSAKLQFQLRLQNFGRALATDVHIRTTIELDFESALLRTAQRLEREEQATHYTILGTGFSVIPNKPYIINIRHRISHDDAKAQ